MTASHALPLSNRASFRDNAGRIVEEEGTLVRYIAPHFLPTWHVFEGSGLCGELIDTGKLIAYTTRGKAASGELAILPERIPFVSYPNEWSLSQLRAAALLTLGIAEHALRFDFVLRDANAFNVQWRYGRPIWIDSLSFERRTENVWSGYGQFCRHFLAPLILGTLCGPDVLRLLTAYSDGIPLQAASQILGHRGWFRPGVLVHQHLHAVASAKIQTENVTKANRRKPESLSKLFESLRSTIEALPVPERKSSWARYTPQDHYGSSKSTKVTFVDRSIHRLKPTSIWDLGANTGDYIRKHVPTGGYALAIDSDHSCVEECCKRSGSVQGHLLPLWIDLLNPTPSVGWAAEERASLSERGPADLVLALALVHHLNISGGIPPTRISSWLARLGRHVIVELADAEDPMVKMLAGSTRRHTQVPTIEQFRVALENDFIVESTQALSDIPRSLLVLRSKMWPSL